MKQYKGCTPEFKLRKINTDFAKVKITGAEVAADFIRRFYDDDIDIYESSFLLLLNRANNTIGYAKIGQGSIDGVHMDVRLVAKYAIDSLASAVILAHNHPSENLSPSKDDINVTKNIKNGLSYFNISLLDHLILSKNSYTSLAEEGFL
jgi:DNA repair protein RadC